MLSFCTKHFFLTRRETWFYRGEQVAETDYNVYPYTEANFTLAYDKKITEETVVLFLDCSKEQLFSGIHSTFRYHIRQAERAGLTFNCIPCPSTTEVKNAFQQLRAFSEARNFRIISLKRLFAMHEAGALRIMYVEQGGVSLATHMYLTDENRAVLLATWHNDARSTKQLRSQANKLLHWNAITYFHNASHKVYDFGGINREQLPGITRFKLSFGGTIQIVDSFIRVKRLWKPLFKLLNVV